jgi:hypothetical protein
MRFRLLLSCWLVCFLVGGSTAQLSGTYTIDPSQPPSTTNFQTFGAASAALAAGVSGPVVFKVSSTTFQETVLLNPVTGTSSINPVTFVATGTPAVVDANGAQDGLTLNAACNHIVFENLEFKNMTRNALYAAGPSSTKATFCTFKDCTFDAPATSSSSTCAAYLNYCNDCTFTNCLFAGGGYTVYSQQINRCVFRGCEFDGKGQASYVIAPFNTNDADNLWENCFFHDCGPSGHGLYFNWSSYGNAFFHNTIIMATSNDAVFMGSCCAWSRAQCWRNNIIVNLGTGPATIYGFNGTVLDYNDCDHNCYYAPNSTGGAIQLERAHAGFTQGTLAQWKAFLSANPGVIPAGGGTSWDQNSIEADPVLMSISAPFDVHLRCGSPCHDAGTTTYVPGVWITGLPATYATATDMDGEPRPATNVDIGADELCVMLCLAGTFQINTTVTLNLHVAADAGLTYQLGSALSDTPGIPIDTRLLKLYPDALFFVTVGNLLPSVFQNYAGWLDTSGKATASIQILNDPAIVGVDIYTAFVTIKSTAPSNIQTVSCTRGFKIR